MNIQTRKNFKYKEANNGNPNALHYIATDLIANDNIETGIEFLNQAFEGGDTTAMLTLSHMYRNGLYMPLDNAKGIECLERCAKAGCVSSKTVLASIYIDGDGVERDIDKGVEYFIQAHEGGCMVAYYNLAMYYLKGNVIERDLEKCLHYLTESGKTGYMLAFMRIEDIKNCLTNNIFDLTIAELEYIESKLVAEPDFEDLMVNDEITLNEMNYVEKLML